MGLIQKAFGDIITFSRASNATRIGPNGLVQYAPHNLFLRSQEFDNASWSKLDATVSANSVAAPDGTVTSDKLTENTALAAHELYQSVSITSGIRYTFSFFAKAAGRNFVACGHNGTGSYAYSYFNLSDGTVVSSGTGHTTSIQSVGNGWYRISSTFTSGSTSSIAFEILTSDNGSRVSYTGDGTSGVYLWGAQLSVGSVPGDYTPTTSAAVYGPRFDFDPVTLAARGLLIEEQRTNLLTYSEQFDNAAWTKTRSNVTANAAAAPDGTVTADKLVEDSTASDTHYIDVSGVSFTSGTSYTFSIYAKAGERSAIRIQGSLSRYAPDATFDLSTGTVTSGSGSISSSGNGWYRCSVTATATSTGTSGINIFLASPGIIYTGNGTSGLFIWGAQLEAGSFATSYIPTVASTVTRSADVASVDTLSPWYNQTAGSLYTEAVSGGDSASYKFAAELTAAGRADAFAIAKDSTNLVRYQAIGASGTAFNSTDGTWTVGAVFKTAIGMALNSSLGVKNGGTAVTGATPTVLPIPIKMGIGQATNGTLQFNGHIRRLAYYPRKLSSAELQALTA